MPTPSKPKTTEVQAAKAVDPAAICSAELIKLPAPESRDSIYLASGNQEKLEAALMKMERQRDFALSMLTELINEIRLSPCTTRKLQTAANAAAEKSTLMLKL